MDALSQPPRRFLSIDSAGPILLLIAAIVAMAWANAPWGHTYFQFWHAKVGLNTGGSFLGMSLQHWINDGLMVVFFLFVGLEIKEELLFGQLASLRRAALPVAAAIGGMVAPAAIYASLNGGGPGAAGWGIPMATDIAFAVGVLSLVGRAAPASVKVFLLAVAIVDDLGAVLVIATFYTTAISLPALGMAGVFLAALLLLNACRIHRSPPYIVLGIALWAAVLLSGVHSTIAGVLLAFTIPGTRSKTPATDPPTLPTEPAPLLTRMHAALKGPTSLVIVPLFALANAGVDLRSVGGDALNSPVTWGVILGLALGKPIGILLSTWLAIKSGVARLPHGASAKQIFGVSVLCGIGFTMSLFVGNLAFKLEPEHLSAAKIGVLCASLACGIVGAGIIMRVERPHR